MSQIKLKKLQDQELIGYSVGLKKKGIYLVGEKIINNVNLEHLQKLFGIDSGNPMYNCYLVESIEQINYLQSLLDFKLDTKSYDYFIECDRK